MPATGSTSKYYTPEIFHRHPPVNTTLLAHSRVLGDIAAQQRRVTNNPHKDVAH